MSFIDFCGWSACENTVRPITMGESHDGDDDDDDDDDDYDKCDL